MKQIIKERIEQINNGIVPEGFIKSAIGIVPKDWNIIEFSDLFTEFCEYTEDFNKYPLYTLSIEEGIIKKPERYEREHLVKKDNAYKVLPSDYYAYNPMNARFGAISRNKVGESVAVSGYYDIFTSKEKTDLLFMDSYLTSPLMITYYNRMATGSLVEKQRVHYSQFIGFKLPMPDVDERKKIAEILSTQDKVIELKEKLIEQKKQQKKYLSQQLLSGRKRNCVFNDKWILCKLSTLLVAGDKNGVEDTSKYQKMTVKLFLKGLDYTKNDRQMADTRPFYIRHKNEIIIGKQNYFNGSIAIVSDEFDGCICSNAIMSFSVKNADYRFVYYYISQNDFLRKREMLANGTGQKELSETAFLGFEIKTPCLEEQKLIADILSKQDKEIDLLEQELEQEKQKKKALMQLLLTGIVRVKND